MPIYLNKPAVIRHVLQRPVKFTAFRDGYPTYACSNHQMSETKQ